MDATARQEAIEEIKQLKARYFYCVDSKEWSGFGEVFAEDCSMDMAGEAPPDADPSTMVFKGREHIVGAISSALDTMVTIHQGNMPIIQLLGDDAATGIWAMEDNLFFPDGAQMHGYGHYKEKYRKIDGKWQIVNTTVTRLHKSFTPGTATA